MNTSLRVLSLLAIVGCTGQLPGSFRYQQQDETFPDQQKVNTKIDLLWVVDNSSSMDVSQKALRDKLAGFATKYLKPYWDIRIGVITTDTYLANPVFSGYLDRTITGSTNYKSAHLSAMIASRVSGGGTVSNDDRLQKLSLLGVSVSSDPSRAGIFTQGIKFKDLVPVWSKGADYARLLPGVHDGPIPGLCVERLPYFIAEDSVDYPLVAGPSCKLRDAGADEGPANCLNPASGTTSVNQCVNTALNDTVRSGSALIETKAPSTVTDTDAWVTQLVQKFTVNVSAGSAGNGSERGLGSVVEFLNVNEVSDTAFFRKGSLRGIIFLSDEDDQTLTLPDLASIPTNFTPDTDYVCDLDALVTANTGKFTNPSDYIQNQYKYCCTGGTCALPNEGCAPKIVDGVTTKVGVCPKSNKLVTVSSIKDTFDTFFASLDGEGSDPNYFVSAIVPTTAASVTALQTARYQSDDRLDILPFFSGGVLVTQKRLRLPAVDIGSRYIELTQLVGRGSTALDIGSNDYAELLDKIGKTLVERKSKFHLNFAPSTKDEMIVAVVHADGTKTEVRHDQYEFSGKVLTITDEAFILSLKSTDTIGINYQPKSLD